MDDTAFIASGDAGEPPLPTEERVSYSDSRTGSAGRVGYVPRLKASLRCSGAGLVWWSCAGAAELTLNPSQGVPRRRGIECDAVSGGATRAGAAARVRGLVSGTSRARGASQILHTPAPGLMALATVDWSKRAGSLHIRW